MKKSEIEKMFGLYLCSDTVLAKFMPKRYFSNYQKIKAAGGELDVSTASAIAKAIKNWAIINGATHYSHWFAPLTGKTAEKQVSFIEVSSNGTCISDFNEKSLIKGETDASSFPNGGERITFEARGYTVWDYTSPVFIKKDSLNNKVVYIPTAFCSYTGTALDEKTPLLRALESLNNQSMRILKHFGYNDVKKVIFNVGAEQEYFLIDKQLFDGRLDLKMSGRTLLGARPIKSQDVYSHYFGMISDDVSTFMNEVNHKLWQMGITAKIQHNEVAPSQHELVPIFNSANIASDQNQVIMEVLNSVANKHNYKALFHEKPFSNINGSGKHINWSLSTDTGLNLLDVNLSDNKLFLLFITAVITAIDKYYKLIKASTAYRGNDLRLGGSEAPPALLSVFIGEHLEEVLNALDFKNSNKENMEKVLDTRVKSLPKTIKDYCDRNRTSPIAFGGNKFEFRMVGSSQSIAWPITTICASLAQVLGEIATKLDNACTGKCSLKSMPSPSNKKKEKINSKGLNAEKTIALLDILRENIKNHRRIIFNGNGYENSWKIEASKRGLIECNDSLKCYQVLDDKDVIDMFKATQVLNENELALRKSTLIKNYLNTLEVEAKTLLEMLHKQVYPCLNKYITQLSVAQSGHSLKSDAQATLLLKISNSLDKMFKQSENLKNYLCKTDFNSSDIKSLSTISSKIIENMDIIRATYDDIESLIPSEEMPFADYNKILF